MSTIDRYNSFKSINFEKITQIPANWEYRRLKMVTTFAYGDTLAAENRVDGEVPVFGSNGIVGYHNHSNMRSPCIIIGRKGSFGKVIYNERDGFAIDTTYYIDNRFTICNLKWLYYVLVFLKLDSMNKDSAVPGLAREDAYRMIIPFPSTNEQTQIAKFLDYKTKQIDLLIEKKKELIEKLKEKRIALITKAVTKGIDDTVEMKDSGIEWLGDIPKHWEVRRLKFISKKILTGSTPLSNGPDYFMDGTIDWFSPSDFKGELILKNAKKKIIQDAVEQGIIKLYPAKVILVVGIGATLGKVGFTVTPSTSNQQINAIILDENQDAKYIAYALTVQNEIMKIISNATTLGIMNQEKTKQIVVAVPTRIEQISITNYIDSYLSQIDKMFNKVLSIIEKLEEYKTSLITSAVTGKIDVRDWEHEEGEN